MSARGKAALWAAVAALALWSAPDARAAALNEDVNVVISVTMAQVLLGWDPAGTDDIDVGNEGNDVTWALPGTGPAITYLGIYETKTGGSHPEAMLLRNCGSGAIDVDLEVTDGSWNLHGDEDPSDTDNAYCLWYSLNEGVAYTHVAASPANDVISNLLSNTTQDFDLKIQLPRTGAAATQTITLKLTASAH